MVDTNELREIAKRGPLTTTVDSGMLHQVADEIDRLRAELQQKSEMSVEEAIRICEANDSFPELVTTDGVAEILGWHKSNVNQYVRGTLNPSPYKRVFFPLPLIQNVRGAVFVKSQILQFKKELDERKTARSK